MRKSIEVFIAFMACTFILMFLIEGVFNISPSDFRLPSSKEYTIMTYTSSGDLLDVYEVKGKIKEKNGTISFKDNGKKVKVHGEYTIREK